MTSTPDIAEAARRPGSGDQPVPFVTAPSRGLGIFHVNNVFDPSRRAWVWFVGCHGGAGESTLADLLPGAGATDHRWPVVDSVTPPDVVLVARTSVTGLLAARTALTQWAAGDTPPVRLLGLVLSADAPGRMPRSLRDLAERVAGGVRDRHIWQLPWIDAWRTGDRADHKITAPLFGDIGRLTES